DRRHPAPAGSQGAQSRAALQADQERHHRLPAGLGGASAKDAGACRLAGGRCRSGGWRMRRYDELWELTQSFPGPKGPTVVVRDFSLNLAEGDFLCLIGRSGCGKSTVLSMVAGLQEATSGGVTVAGREIEGPGPDRGVVFQSPSLLPWMTALENVRLA